MKRVIGMSNGTEKPEFDWFGPEAATFGDRIAGAREVAGMTQPELAKRLGIKIATLRGWEEDRSEPRANRLQMLSGLLNVSLPWILTGEGQGPEQPASETPMNSDISDLFIEMRAIKTDMTKAAERLALLEKRLRVSLRNNG